MGYEANDKNKQRKQHNKFSTSIKWRKMAWKKKRKFFISLVSIPHCRCCFRSRNKKAFNPVSIFVFAVRLYRLFCRVFDVLISPLSIVLRMACMCVCIRQAGIIKSTFVAQETIFSAFVPIDKHDIYAYYVVFVPFTVVCHRLPTNRRNEKKNDTSTKYRECDRRKIISKTKYGWCVHGKKCQDKNACSKQKIKIGKTNKNKIQSIRSNENGLKKRSPRDRDDTKCCDSVNQIPNE